ncbi:MAG: hypothetical protein AAF601_01050 [Pseudomonadota bacterium]
MTLHIHRRFIALITATSIAITGFSAAPARANDEAAAIAALLGLAVIGAVIADRRKDKRVVVHPKPPVRPLPPRVNRKLLPQHCLRSFQTNNGPRRIFGQRCLSRNYQYARSLPSQCHRQFWTDQGWRAGFGARCLRREGYQLARR